MTLTPLYSKAKAPVFQSLQAGRGIAAVAVVLYHSEGLLSVSKYWGKQSYVFLSGASGVDFFFVLSGIVILHAHLKDINRPQGLGAYIQKRFKRIYPIYWIILFSLLSMYFVFPGLGKGFERQGSSIVDSVILLPIFQLETIIPVAWTLQQEVMFYVAFGFLIWNKNWGRLILAVWMLGSVVALRKSSGHSLIGVYFMPQHLLFGMGMVGRLLWERVQWRGLFLAVFGVSGFIICAAYQTAVRPSLRFLPLAYGFFALLAILGCMLIEKRRPLKIPKVLMILGDASYSLYLVHYAVISAAAKPLYRIWLRHPTPLAFQFIALVSLAIGAGLVVHYLVEAPLLALMSKSLPRERKVPE